MTAANILIVEDEAPVAHDTKEALISLGYNVTGIAASAEEALESATAFCPDIVLMDVRIEGTRDGIETADLLRKRYATPVIFTTAHADMASVEQAKRTQPHSYVVRPFRTTDLQCAIEIALHGRHLERKLRERERWFATALRSITDGVVAVDQDARITFTNDPAEQLLGRPGAELEGVNASDVLTFVEARSRDPIEDPVARALREAQAFALEQDVVVANAPGEPVTEVNCAPIFGDEEQILGAVVVLRDVTRRRELERQMAVADRMASLGTLAAGVAHEINNPLTFIVGNAHFVVHELERAKRVLGGTRHTALIDCLDRAIEAARESEQGADRIKRIVADLTVFGRSEDARRHLVDVVTTLRWALRVTGKEVRERARLVDKLVPVPPVVGSDTRLGQVFVNVIVNAVHALEEGRPDRNVVEVATHTDAGHVVVSIRDTGTGIEGEHVDRIFEPFFTTKPIGRGTGLGLSVCRGIVQSMGGEISLDTEVGSGTRFTIRMPAASRSVSVPPDDDEVVPCARGRLLVIDDEQLMLSTLKRTLGADHDVVTIQDGVAGLELLRDDDAFDAIICDLMMPTLTGIDIYEALAKRQPELAQRMVFYTGGAYTQRARDFLESTSNPCLIKPFAPEELQGFLAQFIETRRTDVT